MKKDELEVLQDVRLYAERKEILKRPILTPQHMFLHNFLHLHLLKNKLMDTQLQSFLQKENGSFSRLLLKIAHMSGCLQMRYELNSSKYPTLQMLMKWVSEYEALMVIPFVPIHRAIFNPHFWQGFNGEFEEIILFLDITSKQILKLVRKRDQNGVEYPYHDELNSFLYASLPYTYFCMLLDERLIHDSVKSNNPIEMLFINESILNIAMTSKAYQHLLKSIFEILLKVDLKPKAEQMMIESAMKYFFLFYPSEESKAGDVLLAVLRKVSEAAKFAISDELLIFVRIVQKLKLNKFIEAIFKWNEWIREMVEKVMADDSLVGHSLVGFPTLFPIGETITVLNRTTEERYIEVFHQNSLLVYMFAVSNYDINIKLYYVGDFETKIQIKKLIFSYDKHCGLLKNAMVLRNRGIYLMEFDNSYSWFKNKEIKFQKSILSLEEKTSQKSNWMSYLFGQQKVIYQPSQADRKFFNTSLSEFQLQKTLHIDKKDKKQTPKSDPMKREEKSNNKPNPKNASNVQEQTIELLKVKDVFSLKVVKGSHVYEYETQDEKQIVKKLQQVTKRNPNAIIDVNEEANVFLDNHEKNMQKGKREKTIQEQKTIEQQKTKEEKHIAEMQNSLDNGMKNNQIKEEKINNPITSTKSVGQKQIAEVLSNKKAPPLQIQQKSSKSSIPPPPKLKSMQHIPIQPKQEISQSQKTNIQKEQKSSSSIRSTESAKRGRKIDEQVLRKFQDVPL